MSPVLNAVAFQALWAAIVLGAAAGKAWLGPLALAAWLPVHFALSAVRRGDLVLLLVLGGAGPLLDAALAQLGLLSFKGEAWVAGLAPLWLNALWANFALTLNHSLRGLLAHPLAAAVLGAIGGPLAYWAGARAGAVTLAGPAALVALGLSWAIITPACARLLAPRRAWAEVVP